MTGNQPCRTRTSHLQAADAAPNGPVSTSGWASPVPTYGPMSRSPIPPTLPLLAMLALITRWSMFALSCPISMVHDPLSVPRPAAQRHPSGLPGSGSAAPFPSGTESHPSVHSSSPYEQT
ncbi:hypothetical protein V8C44DRAFT_315817 [Trichoderma aethiopicum]